MFEKTGDTINGIIPLSRLGSQGLFVAIIMSIFTIEIFNFIVKKNIIIKMPDSVPPAVSKSFAALIPGFFVIMTALIIRILFEVSPFGNIHKVVEMVLTKPLTALGGSFFGMMGLSFITNLLWSAGIHGSNLVTGGIAKPVLDTLMDQNRIALSAGKPLPNIVTTQFFDIFHNMGGSGTTFSLAIMLLFLSKSKQLKEIGKLAIGPAFFNINEPILFGLPIVMNPILIIPFILAPLVTVMVTYLAMYSGLVAKITGVALALDNTAFHIRFPCNEPLVGDSHTSSKLFHNSSYLLSIF